MDRLDLLESQLVALAPGGKLRDGDEVRLARVPVPDVGREELPEALGGLAAAQEDRRQGSRGRSADGRELAAGRRRDVGRFLHGFLRWTSNSSGSKSSAGSIYEQPRPAVYLPAPVASNGEEALIIEFARGAALPLPAIQREIAAVAPDLKVVSTTTSDQLIQTAMYLPRTAMRLVGALALLAGSLAAFGLYVVAASSIDRRRYEFAVRVAVGAQQRDILRLIVLEIMAAVAVGIAVGSGLVLAAAKMLSFVLYQVKPTDVSLLCLSALGVTLVAAVATLIPARRVRGMDCSRFLRYE